ncbi:hypothetical protein [Tunicatimonas pelagia]|uniref:hypothetical protein n=1 Tax=Tunicatimonas pelagia TaxID=931531 RepID=UPI002665A455|nr:hypothetical protein [Tunicatimonas pelagia]WKN43692.1 hypothetical protein P0M28_01745 [Tunicatimonas pelagia]
MIFIKLYKFFIIIGSCSDDENLTTFQGNIVFPEDFQQDPKSAVRIFGYDPKGIGDPGDILVDTVINLDHNNHFEVALSGLEAGFYVLQVFPLDDDGGISDSFSIDCSPHDCNSLTPGKSYDLTIRVLE